MPLFNDTARAGERSPQYSNKQTNADSTEQIQLRTIPRAGRLRLGQAVINKGHKLYKSDYCHAHVRFEVFLLPAPTPVPHFISVMMHISPARAKAPLCLHVYTMLRMHEHAHYKGSYSWTPLQTQVFFNS